MTKVISLAALFAAFSMTMTLTIGCSIKAAHQTANNQIDTESTALAKRNLERSMAVLDTAVAHYFVGEGMAMGRFYNPFTGKLSDERASVWMYSSAIEAVNAILHALEAARDKGDAAIYKANSDRYK